MTGIWAIDNKPTTRVSQRTWTVKAPARIELHVVVDNSGYINEIYGTLEGRWIHRGPIIDRAAAAARRELVRQAQEYLKEWELIMLCPIGPEDSEYFATTALDPDWGVE